MPRLSKLGAAALAAFGWTSGSAGVTVDFLVIAGGGGGNSGGGGAGGYRTSAGTSGGGASAEAKLSLNPTQSYTVTVGAGGSANANGSNSVFSSITSTGGGKGGTNTTAAGNGGSGGGAYTAYKGTGTAGQGYDGGGGNANGFGGGGGAGAVGGNNVTTSGGAGGAGVSSSITGSAVTRAGGGGGGGLGTGGAGGSGGGGTGETNAGGSTGGTANTGGGGGGNYNSAGLGSAGGSGIVIISYAGAQKFGGGVVTSSGGNTIHTFTTSGTLSPITPLSASYLVVAGGAGGGGSAYSGGGGAGGLLSGSGLTIDPNSTYLVTVGAGGAGGSGGAFGVNGSNSVFLSITSTGGGGGSFGDGSGGTRTGNSGGSGGGGASFGTPANTGSGGAGTSGQGNAGGNGGTDAVTYRSGGGGGGAGAVGANISSGAGGNGGAGTASSISGSSVTYAGGGGGAGNTSNGTGGSGGGGSAPSGTGTANTGGGGGGVGASGSGGAGGSGIVIISYPGSTQQMAGGTVTITGGNVIHTFTSSGYLTPIKYVSNSLRFRSSASAYLNRTLTTPTNNKIFTISAWVKRGLLSTSANQQILAGYVPATSFDSFFIGGSTREDKLVYLDNTAGYLISTQVFRDPSAWYHIMAAVDTTQATASNRVKLYVNGTQITSFSTANYPSLNQAVIFNSAVAHTLGSFGYNSTAYFDGYMTEFNFIDGQQLTPNSFGTINSYGVWQPINYGGSYGNNGFCLPFTNKTSTTTLGYDFSPNGNNWTTNNISLTAGSTYDSMTDVPTLTSATAANFATLNPIRPSSSGGFSNGNLTGTAETSTQRGLTSTIALPWNGKWYAEVTFASSIYNWCGVTAVDFLAADINTAGQMSVLYYASNGNKYVNGTASAYGASYTTETIGIAFDGPAGTITFYKANTSQGAITLPSSTVNYVFCQANAAGSAVAANWNFGQQPWTYTPPSGFVALNTYNL